MNIVYDVPVPKTKAGATSMWNNFLETFEASVHKTACLEFNNLKESKKARNSLANITRRWYPNYKVILRGESIYVVKGGEK